jgi:hypothetical protein
MAKDSRELRHGEKRLAVFTSEKGRDRATAERAIEGLNQNDQIIALLREQNDLLRYACERLAAIETRSSTSSAPTS